MKSSYEDPRIGLQRQAAHASALIDHCYSFADRGTFDLVHSTFLTEGRRRVQHSPTPTVVTTHNPFAREANPDQFPLVKDIQSHIFISQSQRRGHEDFRTIPGSEVIYHGIDLNELPFNPYGGDHMTMIGRLKPQKGPLEAVQVAQMLDIPLTLVGSPSQNPAKMEYWQHVSEIIAQKPDVITLAGFVDHTEIASYFGAAKVSLFPIQGEEAFGLTTAESMATGTPPIATATASMLELIIDGETGYLVPPEEGVAGFVRAVQKLYSLRPEEYQEMRRRCRQHVENKFSKDRMLRDYEKAYYTLTGKIG